MNYNLPFNSENSLTLQSHDIAIKSHSALLVTCGKTVLLVTINIGDSSSTPTCAPLTVHYQTRSYAVGAIPQSFPRREGRPGEQEILISRLIDRSVRPLLVEHFALDTQIIVTVLSYDQHIANSDVMATNAVIAALKNSCVPLTNTVASARVAYYKGEYVINPNYDILRSSVINLFVTASLEHIFMIECSSSQVSNDLVIEGILFCHEHIKTIILNIDNIASNFTKKLIYKDIVYKPILTLQIKEKIKTQFSSEISHAFYHGTETELKQLIDKIVQPFEIQFSTQENGLLKYEVDLLVKQIATEVTSEYILQGYTRVDGRTNRQIRNIEVLLNILPNSNGSCLFTRGITQVLSNVVIGNDQKAQILDGIEKDSEEKNRFIYHYNFPPFCVGEVGATGSPKRREIGHGALARKGLLAVLPKNYPYVIRIVSEVLSADGSTSMASLCSATGALLNAQIPIIDTVAGIAMGLIKIENKFCILTDISHKEDMLGDLDLKMIASKKGITALQMDTKHKDGVSLEVLKLIFPQAREAIDSIIEQMHATLDLPGSLSRNIPIFKSIAVEPDNIKFIIGKKGANIRYITETSGATIDICSTTNLINITANSIDSINKAIELINTCTNVYQSNDNNVPVNIGDIYNGTVIKLLPTGAILRFSANKTGLLSIKRLAFSLAEGQVIQVIVASISPEGKVKLKLLDHQ